MNISALFLAAFLASMAFGSIPGLARGVLGDSGGGSPTGSIQPLASGGGSPTGTPLAPDSGGGSPTGSPQLGGAPPPP